MVVSARATIRPPAPSKLKILATADELFYQEGIHTVGVDRIIAGARVTKATFYKHYRSKDLLIIAYVEGRDRQIRDWFDEQERDARRPARDRARPRRRRSTVEAVRPGFRGDPFINAAAQFADENHPVRVAVTAHRDWYAHRIEELFREIGHPRPGRRGRRPHPGARRRARRRLRGRPDRGGRRAAPLARAHPRRGVAARRSRALATRRRRMRRCANRSPRGRESTRAVRDMPRARQSNSALRRRIGATAGSRRASQRQWRAVGYSETRSSSSIWARVRRMPAAAMSASTCSGRLALATGATMLRLASSQARAMLAGVDSCSRGDAVEHGEHALAATVDVRGGTDAARAGVEVVSCCGTCR